MGRNAAFFFISKFGQVYLPLNLGPVAERLGSGLQNLLQRFESARDLCQKPPSGGFLLLITFAI